MGCSSSCSVDVIRGTLGGKAASGGQGQSSVYDARRLLSELIEVQTAVLVPAQATRDPGVSHMYPRLGTRMGVTFIQVSRSQPDSKSRESSLAQVEA